MLGIYGLKIVSYILLGFSLLYFLQKNDEVPFLIAVFFYMTGISRYEAVVTGDIDWVVVNYIDNFFILDEGIAVKALNLFVAGTIILMVSYIFFKNKIVINKRIHDSRDTFQVYSVQKQKLIVLGFLVFFPLSTFMNSMISGPGSLGNSYFWLFSLAVGGLIILLFNSFKQDNNQSVIERIIYILIFIFAATMSFNPTVRFQFLSWVIAVGVYVCGEYSVKKKLAYYTIGGIILIIVFAIAGVARERDFKYMTWEEKLENAIERNESKSDQNMLDGFMMVLQVYPGRLDYEYGKDHLSILTRPIPRQLWPGKPMGSYVNKLGLNDLEKGTIGISPTLYGSFYGEGGVVGIIIFSIIYGYFIARIILYSELFSSGLRWIIKGILLASLLPLLRGGDLPGVYAFIGMSFWPVFLFVYFYLKKLRNEKA